MYAAKLRARRKALGLDVPGEAAAAAASEKQQQQGEAAEDAPGGDGEGPMEEDGEGGAGGGGGGSGSILASLKGEAGGGGGGSGGDAGADDADAAVAAVLSGALAGVVAKSAAAALPRDLELRRGMLAALGRFDLPGLAAVADAVAAGLEADFPEVRQGGVGAGGVCWEAGCGRGDKRGLRKERLMDGGRRRTAGGCPPCGCARLTDLHPIQPPQDPDAVDILARRACDPATAGAPGAARAAAVERFEAAIATATAAAGGSGRGEGADEEAGDEQGGAGAKQRRRVRRDAAARLQRLWGLYGAYLRDCLDADLAAAAAAGGAAPAARAAAASAAALLQALQRAHDGGGAGEEVYRMWADAALELKQKKVGAGRGKEGGGPALRVACGAWRHACASLPMTLATPPPRAPRSLRCARRGSRVRRCPRAQRRGGSGCGSRRACARAGPRRRAR
jgi:hypothetical protein